MGSKVEKLASLLESAASLLRSHDEAHWASWLEKDAALLKASDFGGVEHFLGAFRGMGSINDLVLHPMNGHRLMESEIAPANERLQALLSEARELAKQVRSEAIVQ
jgi:hypothetical protein